MLRRCVRRCCYVPPAGTRVVAVGDAHSITRTFSAADVRTYCELTGDANPVHTNTEAAIAQGFKACVVHGMLTSSLFSQIMGMQLPGPNSIYLQQTLNFRAPVLVDDVVEGKVVLTRVDTVKGNLFFDTTVTRVADGVVAVEGKAIGRNVVVAMRNAEGELVAPVAVRRQTK